MMTMMKWTIMMMTVMAMVMMTRWWVLPCVHITVASSFSGQTVSHHLSLHLDRMIIIIHDHDHVAEDYDHNGHDD